MRLPRALFALLAGASACAGDAFVCQTDDQCVHDGAQGRCELVSMCSFADTSCARGRRFGDLAGGLAGQCVSGVDPLPDGQIIASFGDTGDASYDGTTRNTSIDSSSPTSNLSGSSELRTDAEPLRYGLLRFDLSTLPAGAQVSAAELRVWTTSNGALPAGSTELFRVREGWTEDASWTTRAAGTSWSTPNMAPPVRDAAPVGAFVPADSVRLVSRHGNAKARRPLLVVTYR